MMRANRGSWGVALVSSAAGIEPGWYGIFEAFDFTEVAARTQARVLNGRSDGDTWEARELPDEDLRVTLGVGQRRGS